MAKRKRSNRPPQLQHGKKSIPSQHDKRSRLCTPNPTRRKTESASVPLLGGIAVVITAMQTLMHGRIGFRLPIVWLVPRGLVVAERPRRRIGPTAISCCQQKSCAAPRRPRHRNGYAADMPSI